MKNVRSPKAQKFINLLCLPHLDAIAFPTSTILRQCLTFYSNFSPQITWALVCTGCHQSSGPRQIRRVDTRSSVHHLYSEKGLNLINAMMNDQLNTWSVVKHCARFLVIWPVISFRTLVATIQQWKLYQNWQYCTKRLAHRDFMDS